MDYNANNICIGCRNLYYLSNTNTCRRNPDFCQIADSLGFCTSCALDYYANQEGICEKALEIRFCRDYDRLTNVCLRCQDLYYLSNPQTCVKNPLHCLEANSSGMCSRCATGYALSEGYCFIFLDFCDFYDKNSGFCSRCASGYTLSEGRCTRKVNYEFCLSRAFGFCNRCIARYYWSSLYCSPYPAYCSNVDFKGNCLGCCYGSTLIDGKCIANQDR